MRLRSRIVLAALAAMIVVATAVGVASANKLSVNEPIYLVRWKEGELFRVISEAETFSAKCVIRLKGRFHSTSIVKSNNTLIASVTESRRTNCTEGNIWVLNGVEVIEGERNPTTNSLPWNILYVSFSGRLPLITSIRTALVGLSILVREFFESCLYRTTLTRPLFLEFLIEANGAVTGTRADETTLIPAAGGVGFCPELQLGGTARENTTNNKEIALRFKLI
jgi:hypothetical protein